VRSIKAFLLDFTARMAFIRVMPSCLNITKKRRF
jgi:hypothetical protein